MHKYRKVTTTTVTEYTYNHNNAIVHGLHALLILFLSLALCMNGQIDHFAICDSKLTTLISTNKYFLMQLLLC